MTIYRRAKRTAREWIKQNPERKEEVKAALAKIKPAQTISDATVGFVYGISISLLMVVLMAMAIII
ncbi:MAG: hypothetical protein ACTSWQ_00860 [Candidatus Thorarchaeota archaeon]